MKRFVFGLAAMVLVLAVVHPARCEVKLTLDLDRSEATLDDNMSLSVSVSGAHGNDARPTLRGLEDFLVRPAGTSTRVEIVNGQYSAGTDFSYLLQPKKAGTFRIGPAEVTLGGVTYQSNVVTLAVGNAPAAANGERGPIFLVAALAPGRVYVEQQAVYTLKLYRLVNIGNATVNVPEVEGLTFTKIGEPREYQGVYQGRSYQIIEVRYLLTPRKAGQFTVTPARMDLTVFMQDARRRRGIFDDPFFGHASSGREQTLSSEALALQVLPLPLVGRPPEYGGLVGSFTLEATIEPQTLKAGESATLTATIRGRGNVKRIPELSIPPLDGVKIYADQPLQKDETDADGVSGFKTMKWALVPEREGRYRIPSLAISYFDTAAGRYQTLRTAEATLVVSAGSGNQSAAVAARPARGDTATVAKNAVAEVGRDILPVHGALGTPAAGLSAPPQALVFWVLLIGPPAAFVLTLGGARYRHRSDTIVTSRKVRNAAARFVRTCKRSGLTAAELMPTLQEYLNQRLQLSHGSLTADEAADLLRSRNVDDATVRALSAEWRRTEDAIYSGKGREATAAGEKLCTLVARIEKDLARG